MARKKLSRPILTIGAAILVVAALTAAFWPRATMVDIGEVSRGEMMLTIDEEGRTRVRDAFVVSTPVDGRLLRVEVRPGDAVTENASVVAQMRPANPSALDARTRGQAMAAVEAAEAALRVAEANLEAARADLDVANSDVERARRLAESGTVSQAALDRAEGQARAAEAGLHTAEAAIAQRRAELQSAQAQLIGFDDRGLLDALEAQLGDVMPIYSPTDGVILRVINEDETTLPAGSPILEVGDVRDNLEVVVELISSDAVQVSVGDDVIIESWGGPGSLAGTVTRVEPFGQTKTSALGVEEQRVTVVVRISSPPERREGLGHGFRVETRIVIWQSEDAVIVPSSALFRDGDGWAVFVVRDERAETQAVEIGRDNGLLAEVLGGLEPGEQVVQFPSATLTAGTRVAQRVVE
ncbi:efflux RND transporter periplasmic adaptor subunit [Pseudoruegeria sp. HB172150]|uniref:efflux RND transporter periplasmic adaptor subunit n=1 Tax=Pseudoruegeria sp. HB172150 TaxID=2721164 RepID=UPI001556B315|nr:HlyD family efflux transporter periplasmic adaptor subunit [Pseudoruegeria sp. HB172150]